MIEADLGQAILAVVLAGGLVALLSFGAGHFFGWDEAQQKDLCNCAHCKAHREEEKATRCGTCGGKLTDKESGT